MVYTESAFKKGNCYALRKTRGPYQNRFDLPGGGQELGEGLTETLEREVLEETGYTLSRYSNPRIYDVMVQEGGQDFAVHHIMAFYDIVLDFERSQKSLPQEVLDGSNDSANAIWIPFEQITEKNCLTLSVEGEGRVSWISRIRTDKLYKLEDKRRITNETSRNVEYL